MLGEVNAISGRSWFSAKQTTSLFFVSGLSSGAYSRSGSWAPGNGSPTSASRASPGSSVADVGHWAARRCAVACPGSWSARCRCCRPRYCRSPGQGSPGRRRHRREFADIAVDHAEQRDDRSLVRGDAVKVAHVREVTAKVARLEWAVACLAFRAHNRACQRRIATASAAQSIAGPKPWLPVVRSAASNAWYAVPQWRLGIRRGCLPIGLSLAPSETRSLTVSKRVFWALLLKCRGLSNRHISSKVSPPAENKSLASG